MPRGLHWHLPLTPQHLSLRLGLPLYLSLSRSMHLYLSLSLRLSLSPWTSSQACSASPPFPPRAAAAATRLDTAVQVQLLQPRATWRAASSAAPVRPLHPQLRRHPAPVAAASLASLQTAGGGAWEAAALAVAAAHSRRDLLRQWDAGPAVPLLQQQPLRQPPRPQLPRPLRLLQLPRLRQLPAQLQQRHPLRQQPLRVLPPLHLPQLQAMMTKRIPQLTPCPCPPLLGAGQGQARLRCYPPPLLRQLHPLPPLQRNSLQHSLRLSSRLRLRRSIAITRSTTCPQQPRPSRPPVARASAPPQQQQHRMRHRPLGLRALRLVRTAMMMRRWRLTSRRRGT